MVVAVAETWAMAAGRDRVAEVTVAAVAETWAMAVGRDRVAGRD